MIFTLSTHDASGGAHRLHPLRNTVAAASFLCLTAGTAQAIPDYFDWTDISGGTAGAITATVVSNIVSGKLGTNAVTATDPGFVSTYGAAVPALSYNAPVSFTPGDVQSTITFSQPLPSGSILMAFDMDWMGETFLLQSDLGFPTLLEQSETVAGEASSLPIYDPMSGLLVETAPDAFPNLFEYSLFDLSGVSSLIANYSDGNQSPGSLIAIGVPFEDPIPPVPAPAGLPLLLSGLALFGGFAWRRRGIV